MFSVSPVYKILPIYLFFKSLKLFSCSYEYSLLINSLFKLNAINEVSYFVYCHLKWHGYKYYLNNFPLIHFWIMKTEMVKFFNGKKNLVPKESQKIRKWRWYKKNIKKCICFFGDISQIIGRNTAFDYCNLSYYTLHKSYKVYFLIDVFFYKYWIRIRNARN